MKRKYLFIVFGLILTVLLCLGGWQYYKTQRIRNIFDEIYYEEADYHNQLFTRNPRAFSKIEGMSFTDSNFPEFYSHRVDYAKETLPDNLTFLVYSFDFRDDHSPYVLMEMRIKLSNTGESVIAVDYKYNLKNQEMTRYMWFSDDKQPTVYNKNRVETLLAENGTTVAAIRKEADRIMTTKLLKDWVSIYPSRFTPEDWGDARLVDVWKEDEE